MTTIYVPALIETAEQAEALPEGTIITSEDKDGPWEVCEDRVLRGAGRRVEALDWALDRTALVPVEAEVETRASAFHVGTLTGGGAEFDDRTGEPVAWEARYLTPWERVEGSVSTDAL